MQPDDNDATYSAVEEEEEKRSCLQIETLYPHDDDGVHPSTHEIQEMTMAYDMNYLSYNIVPEFVIIWHLQTKFRHAEIQLQDVRFRVFFPASFASFIRVPKDTYATHREGMWEKYTSEKASGLVQKSVIITLLSIHYITSEFILYVASLVAT